MLRGDGEELLIVGSPEASIEFGHPKYASDGSESTRIPCRISAPGVEVMTAIEIESWSGGTKALTDYFDDLSASWRGWAGTKQWSDDGPSISMSATHNGISTVMLEVTAESPFLGDRAGTWTVTVSVPVEPGALESVAQRLTRLLA